MLNFIFFVSTDFYCEFIAVGRIRYHLKLFKPRVLTNLIPLFFVKRSFHYYFLAQSVQTMQRCLIFEHLVLESARQTTFKFCSGLPIHLPPVRCRGRQVLHAPERLKRGAQGPRHRGHRQAEGGGHQAMRTVVFHYICVIAFQRMKSCLLLSE